MSFDSPPNSPRYLSKKQQAQFMDKETVFSQFAIPCLQQRFTEIDEKMKSLENPNKSNGHQHGESRDSEFRRDVESAGRKRKL